jgi:hypothetical protein
MLPQDKDAKGSYASVNSLEMYYESTAPADRWSCCTAAR